MTYAILFLRSLTVAYLALQASIDPARGGVVAVVVVLAFIDGYLSCLRKQEIAHKNARACLGAYLEGTNDDRPPGVHNRRVT